ncbi:MAG: BLUF domain-containing protein [Verrucomicrobiota bacterium]
MKRCRLIYRSIADEAFLRPGSLQEMVNMASESNQLAGITGVLVLSGDHFLQCLEGPTKFVNELYGKIIQDPRHRQVELIHYAEVTGTSFYDWGMKILRLDESLPPSIRQSLISKYSESEGIIPITRELVQIHSLLVDARWGLTYKEPS